MDQKTELLLKLDIFRQFYTEEIEIISEYFSIHKFFDLQVILPQTGQDSSFGIILSGEVSVSDDQMENSSRTKGDILGEMAFIQEFRSDFIAASDGAIAIMTFDDIEKLKFKKPYLAVKLVDFVTHNLVNDLRKNDKKDTTEIIVLLADENLFSDLINLIKDHLHIIKNFSVVTSEKLKKILEQNTNLTISQVIEPQSLILGETAIGHQILLDQVKAIVYLRDPVKVESNSASIEALSRLCDLQQVLFSTNLLTANAIFQYLE
jgi:methylglyoxal synthase